MNKPHKSLKDVRLFKHTQNKYNDTIIVESINEKNINRINIKQMIVQLNDLSSKKSQYVKIKKKQNQSNDQFKIQSKWNINNQNNMTKQNKMKKSVLQSKNSHQTSTNSVHSHHTSSVTKLNKTQKNWKQINHNKPQFNSIKSLLTQHRKLHSELIPINFNSQYQIGRLIGKSKFSQVYQAKHHKTGLLVAVKKINILNASQQSLERLFWQIKIQAYLQHQYCIQMYTFYKDKHYLFLIFQLAQKSIKQIINQDQILPEFKVADYIRQIIMALRYLHSEGIIHRDLRPQNIMLVNDVVKLGDFGWACIIPNGQIIDYFRSKRKTFCGTVDYIAPEILLGIDYNQSIDIWSLGILCYELCTGMTPFIATGKTQQTFKNIISLNLKYPLHLTKEAQDFITKLLHKNPSTRLNLKEALQHPWLQKNIKQ